MEQRLRISIELNHRTRHTCRLVTELNCSELHGLVQEILGSDKVWQSGSIGPVVVLTGIQLAHMCSQTLLVGHLAGNSAYTVGRK